VRDFYLILNTSIALALFGLGLISFINNKRPVLNKLFLAFTTSVGIWVISACVSNDTRNNETVSLYGNYLVFAFSYFSAYLLLWFAVLITSRDTIVKWLKILNLPLVFLGLLSATPFVVAGVEMQGNVYAIKFGPLTWLYGILLLIYLIATVWIFVKGLKDSKGSRRSQIKVISRSLFIAIPVLLATQFIAPAITGSFEITDIGILIMVLPVVSLYLSVIKHGLFDIRLAAVRVMAYALSLVTLSVVYYYVAYLVSFILFNGRVDSSVSVSPVNIALALVLAFLFQPVKRFFDRITNKVFYKDNYNTEDFIARLNKSLAVTTDLRSLLEKAAYEIATTLKSDQAFFFINTDINKEHYISDGTDKRRKIPRYDVLSLDKLIDKKKGVLVVSLLDENDPIRRMMLSYDVEIVLPLIQDNVIIGYLFLGHHLTSGYTNRDIKALNTISNELVIAIRNALVIQEIKELNATLQQRINNATRELRSTNATLRQLDKVKDEFVSLASHQLRTPLTSVKGYLSMVLEGDAGKISKAQYQLLNEAFLSSERMVRLINDFLSVSRIQTGKFIIDRTPTDLSVIVEQEMESLKPNAQARNMKLIYKKPKNFPILSLDEGKMRQVIMNFADNAIYYSRDDSDINIKLSIEAGEVVLTVKDTGIGVPKSERDRLFSKFYRASNARKKRPDGTGVGIYLAKRVVNAHDGVIIFESVEGKGSTFGFRLPIKKNS